MAVYMSAAPAATVEGVGSCPQSDGYGADDGADGVEEFAVAPFGGFLPLVAVDGVFPQVVDELPLVAVVEVPEAGHVHRVSPSMVLAALCDAWSSLSRPTRDLLGALLPLGCLFFLVLGAVLR